MEQRYYIYNFINHYLEGYSDGGYPILTCFKEDALLFTVDGVKQAISKLHDMGFTGLNFKVFKNE